MKKFILPILLFLMFIPLYVNAETCDTDKITIENITIESKSDNVEELDEATASGKNINLNLSMSEVGDNIEYKIVVKNDSNEDYELDKNSFNISSDYIKYTIESEDDTSLFKANSSKVVYLKVNYANEVPDDAFESGTYNDNKTITLNLYTGDTISVMDTLKNPNTGVQSYILILFIILLISISTYVLLEKKKYTKFMILIICTAIIIPMSVYALCKYEIKIESKIKINKLTATLIAGNKFNEKLYEYSNYDELIRSESISENNKIEDNIISTEESDTPVYMWQEGNNLYYYSKANIIYLNEDSSYMFYETEFSNLNLTNFDTSKVVNMSYMFRSPNLVELNISNWNTSSLTYMDGMFSYAMWDPANHLTVLDLSSFDTSKVVSMTSFIRNCPDLETVYVSEKFVISENVKHDGGDAIFSYCPKLRGENGTMLNANGYVYDKWEYARIDTPDTPGLFTYKKASQD